MGKARYTVVLEWDPEEEFYIATMPALSVGSYGATEAEALDQVREAAEVTIEGLKATGQRITA
jgi:predicted RNase H-like HicB family nuclease